ncbi:MAG TPA: ArsC/Spx/MgsR family protein [Tichowtungia sp.]|nr:ArsC/Spx/MgsR family protein [Tichowtungia sp.]
MIFYEKTGCKGNARQRALLEAHGVDFEVRSILDESWTLETLRPFFGSLPVAEWFNDKAPEIKSGEIDPASFDEAGALAILLEQPILIRRPLIDRAGEKFCGFGPAVETALGLNAPEGDYEACQEEG